MAANDKSGGRYVAAEAFPAHGTAVRIPIAAAAKAPLFAFGMAAILAQKLWDVGWNSVRLYGWGLRARAVLGEADRWLLAAREIAGPSGLTSCMLYAAWRAVRTGHAGDRKINWLWESEVGGTSATREWMHGFERRYMETEVMQGWFALVGVATGGLVAIVGQYVIRLEDRRNALVDLILEQCAQVIAVEEDIRNRVWEGRTLGLRGPVSEWPLAQYLLAEARLKVACRDDELHEALRRMQAAGAALGKAWRQDQRDDSDIEAVWQQHRGALDHLIHVSGAAVERAQGVRWRRSIR
ncbi:hypothetical protein [Nocardia sp. CA-135398]|uniref:hypothetical protein n=1 Tax=Nocardia sp. CA-135398 TaxID=3239977 RepID=UPI003D99EFC9